jgi:hypothetical protein
MQGPLKSLKKKFQIIIFLKRHAMCIQAAACGLLGDQRWPTEPPLTD